MKSPLWILNSVLAVVLVVLLAVLVFIRPKKPMAVSLVPGAAQTDIKHTSAHVDISLIYKNDLFGTYIEQQPVVQKEEKTVSLPMLPPLKVAQVVPPASPQFLPPLGVSLKGIIYSPDEVKNRAIIADNKTKQEALYKVNDKVLDAEIIRIDSNKIMFIRSNGQQETLFVTQDDAKADPLYNQEAAWDTIAKKITDTEYVVDSETFVERIPNLAHFIDALDITTAFDKGKSIGCRIGRIAPGSAGQLLGLQQGDILSTINDINTVSTKNRVAIYSQIKTIKPGEKIKAVVVRNQQPITLTYTIKQLSQNNVAEEEVHQSPLVVRKKSAVETYGAETIDQTPRYMNTVQQMQKRDKTAMLNHQGGRRSLLRQTQG